MKQMLTLTDKFNQPIGDLDEVTSMDGMLNAATIFNQPIGEWDTSQVRTTQNMFRDASTINQPSGKWVTSQVTMMLDMFYDASAFNQPIDNWNTSQVASMQNMFSGASSFNQCLSTWAGKTPNDVDTNNMLQQSLCPQGYLSTPDPEVGPWCQNFLQGCFVPGLEPSQVPSSRPSLSSAPSVDSTGSQVPNSRPSLNPAPSVDPSSSQVPSSRPSSSSEPSQVPSSRPSSSSRPSAVPSAGPSSRPSECENLASFGFDGNSSRTCESNIAYITYYLIKVAASSLLTGSREFCKSADDPSLYYTTTLY
jgi:surface protein